MFFFRFLDPNSNGFFHPTQANFEANSAKLCHQLPKTQAEYSTNSTELGQILVDHIQSLVSLSQILNFIYQFFCLTISAIQRDCQKIVEKNLCLSEVQSLKVTGSSIISNRFSESHCNPLMLTFIIFYQNINQLPKEEMQQVLQDPYHQQALKMNCITYNTL